MSLTKVGALALMLALPRLDCGGGGDERARARQGAMDPAPSASAVTFALGLGYCENLARCEAECESGNDDRCRRLGVNYEFGHGVEVDGARATALYEKSCGLNDGAGCLSAGRMHEFHHGVAKDDRKAAGLYAEACDLGHEPGCVNFAIMLENGRGVTKDTARAAALYTAACSEGSSLACSHAEALHAATGNR
jgi:TPR repeat protein